MRIQLLAKFLVIAIVLSLSPNSARAARKSSAVVREVDAALVAPPVDNETCFSPENPCDIKLVKFIRSAKKSIDIAIYDLTHPQIAHEIMVASKRISVRVLVDRRQTKEKHSLVNLLQKAGVDVRYGYQRGIMHNKFCVVDKTRIETGSYNYTNHATESNNENQIYLFNPQVAEKYQQRFEDIWARGKKLQDPLS